MELSDLLLKLSINIVSRIKIFKKGPKITPKWSRWRSFLISLFILVPTIMILQNFEQKKHNFIYCFLLLIKGSILN